MDYYVKKLDILGVAVRSAVLFSVFQNTSRGFKNLYVKSLVKDAIVLTPSGEELTLFMREVSPPETNIGIMPPVFN